MEILIMLKKSSYEERILKEIHKLPHEALPKLCRLISLIKEDFLSKEAVPETLDEGINHKKTRSLLSTSKSNWARDVIADREDRI